MQLYTYYYNDIITESKNILNIYNYEELIDYERSYNEWLIR